MSHTHSLIESIYDVLSQTLGEIAKLQWVCNLPGGDINQAALIRSGNTDWFLKYHMNAPDGMFETEAQALAEISEQACIRVPSPIALGNDSNTAWLVLEYLDLKSNGPTSILGEQLAVLHSINYEQYGWKRDNFIGSTPQHNMRSDNWTAFWRDRRLQPQFVMAKARGSGSRLLSKSERLLENMDQLMDGHQPAASLLHGDLWAGNKAFTQHGKPVIFDPASYYGDRETDIAMTELFGGFGPDFYSAYQAHSPLPEAYRLRRDLYNLYHVLNHLNLFGDAYLCRCESMIDKLMAQIR